MRACCPACSASWRCSRRSRCCCRSIDVVLRPSLPRGVGGAALPASIGAVSAMMGIGGGTLSVPSMTLCGVPVHKAVGTAALLGLWISVPATLGYLLASTEGESMPPWTHRLREPARLRHHRAGVLAGGSARRAARALAGSAPALGCVRCSSCWSSRPGCSTARSPEGAAARRSPVARRPAAHRRSASARRGCRCGAAPQAVPRVALRRSASGIGSAALDRVPPRRACRAG